MNMTKEESPAAVGAATGAEDTIGKGTNDNDGCDSSGQVHLSVFPDLSGKTIERLNLPPDELADWLRSLPTSPTKAACPLVSAGRFGELRSDNGSFRHGANLLGVSAVVADYDAGVMTPQEARGRAELLGIRMVIATTASHGTKGQRFRMLAPFAQEQTPEAAHELTGKLDYLFGGVFAPESYSTAQAFYVGPVQGVQYEVLHTDGHPIDALPGIDALPSTAPEQHRDAIPADPADEWARQVTQRAPSPEALRDVLERIPNPAPDWEFCNRVTMAAYAASGGAVWGREAVRDWRDKCPIDNPTENLDERWQHLHRSPPRELGFGTLVYMAGGASATPCVPFRAGDEAQVMLSTRDVRLLRFNGDWLTFEPGGYYREISDEVIRREIRAACPHPLNQTKVNNAVDEIKAATVVDAYGVTLPHWLEPVAGMPPADGLIVCRNGILNPG